MVQRVKKRDNSTQNFSPTKLNKWAEWACSNTSASWSNLCMQAIQKLPEEVTSSMLQKTLIETAVELISENYDYDKVAAKLLLADLRKEVFGEYTPPPLSIYAEYMYKMGYWDDLLSFYTEQEIHILEQAIDHSRDELFTCGGLKQAIAKYLKKDMGKLLETPQFMYMGMAMALRTDEDYAKNWPIEDIIGIYDEFSLQRVNVPTPPLVGLRSGDRGFASCCLIEAGDSIDSLDAAASAVFKMVANRAGIGYNAITRSIGEGVRNGSFSHTGKLPFYRHIDRATKALTQQTRGGSATVHYTFIDPELEVLLNLKSQRSAEDVKIEFMDYSLVYHPYLLELYIKDKPLKLISLIKHPEVYEALHSSKYEDFVLAYEKAEAEKEISTRDMLHTFMTRRVETGRNYWVNALEVNRHTTFNDRIHMSNLCQEITQPTKPYRNILDLYEPGRDTGGEISLCNLGGIVFGRVDNYERTCYLLLKFIDTIIEIQHLPFPNLEYTSKARRNVAVGIINLANFLASNGLSYEGEEARNLVHKECEKMSFYLHKASNRLAKEIGACPWYRKTKYKDGVLPIDTYNKNVDSLESVGLTLDWDSLRKDIAEYGMRNSTLTACMPGESSSVLLGATNGIEPIRDILVYKKSPAGVTHTLAPGVDDFSTLVSYVNAYDIDREEYIKMVAIITKWMTQSISFNQYYNYKDFDNEIIPMSVLIKDFFLCNKYGIKTAYYHNSGGNNAESAGESCAGGGCSL